MITNSQIQAAWITKIQSLATVTARVDSDEVREDNWKGTDFDYPNIRVKMGLLTPQVQSNPCPIFTSQVSILVFSAQKSSKEADEIAGLIATEVWGKAFSKESIKFVGVSLDSLAPAEPPEDNPDVWVSSVNLSCRVQAA